jgi:hypothetical protein
MNEQVLDLNEWTEEERSDEGWSFEEAEHISTKLSDKQAAQAAHNKLELQWLLLGKDMEKMERELNELVKQVDRLKERVDGIS